MAVTREEEDRDRMHGEGFGIHVREEWGLVWMCTVAGSRDVLSMREKKAALPFSAACSFCLQPRLH